MGAVVMRDTVSPSGPATYVSPSRTTTSRSVVREGVPAQQRGQCREEHGEGEQDQAGRAAHVGLPPGRGGQGWAGTVVRRGSGEVSPWLPPSAVSANTRAHAAARPATAATRARRGASMRPGGGAGGVGLGTCRTVRAGGAPEHS